MLAYTELLQWIETSCIR